MPDHRNIDRRKSSPLNIHILNCHTPPLKPERISTATHQPRSGRNGERHLYTYRSTANATNHAHRLRSSNFRAAAGNLLSFPSWTDVLRAWNAWRSARCPLSWVGVTSCKALWVWLPSWLCVRALRRNGAGGGGGGGGSVKEGWSGIVYNVSPSCGV